MKYHYCAFHIAFRELHEIKTETAESTVVEEEVIIDTLNDIIGDIDSAKVFTTKKRFMERDEQEDEECTEEDEEPIQIQVPLKKRQRMKEVKPLWCEFPKLIYYSRCPIL